MPAPVNIAVVLDAALKRLDEPGFGKEITTRQLAAFGKSHADASPTSIWADPRTHTVMLKPRQLDSTWLDSTNQLPWVIRLAAMDVNPGDTSSGAISEYPAFGNTASPWIYHYQTVASDYFPGAPAPGEGPPEAFPGAAPSVVGISPGIDPAVLDPVVVRPNAGYALPAIMPPAPPSPQPIPQKTVSTTTGRFLAQTKDPLVANQPLFIRWLHASNALGFPSVYRFYIGQFALDIKESYVQVCQDVSPHGDRSQYKHVATLNLYSHSPAGLDEASIANNFEPVQSHDGQPTPQHRWLLWLPFRRHQVLLYANTGRSKVIQTRPRPQRLPDNSDWDIVRSDKLMAWFLVPHWGRFQIQRVAYPGGASTVDYPPVVLDFVPAANPIMTGLVDSDHGTSINFTQSSPPNYPLPVNNSNDCPKIPAGIATIQARQYGFTAQLAASPIVANTDAAWTPFLYNLKVTRDPMLVPSTAAPKTVGDVTASPPAGATVLSAEFSVGIKPGEGKATIHVADFRPYGLEPFYYRCGNPIQITAGGVPAFTGYTLPLGIEPLRKQDTHPRRIVISAADRWWQLTQTWLRDNRDWSGVGHIDVVQTVMAEAGIDATAIDSPPKNPGTNQVLGLVGPADLTAMELEGRTLGPWQPRPGETAASFIQRIAQHFSGWDVGFQADGTPFYLPRYFRTTSELTFYENQAQADAAGEANPRFYRRTVFSTIEPEANAILVVANSSENGGRQYSSIFVDFASIKNPSVVNYMGRYKAEVVEIFGIYSCAGINWAARTIWNQTRRRHIIARFECDYDPKIKVGHVITLHGYGNYRVRSILVRFDKQTWHHATVEAEFIELGFGLPTGTPTG